VLKDTLCVALTRLTNDGLERLTSTAFNVPNPSNVNEVFVSCIDLGVFSANSKGMLIDTYLETGSTNISLAKVLTVGSAGPTPASHPGYAVVTPASPAAFQQYCVTSDTTAGGTQVPAGSYTWNLQQACPSSISGGCGGQGRDAFFARPFSGEGLGAFARGGPFTSSGRPVDEESTSEGEALGIPAGRIL
jgi:hypothetical protein